MQIITIDKVNFVKREKKKKNTIDYNQDEPDPPEDIKSTMDWDDITESHFEQE